METFWCWTGKNVPLDEASGGFIEELDAKSAAASCADDTFDEPMGECEYEIIWVRNQSGIVKKFEVTYDEESGTYWAEELPNA